VNTRRLTRRTMTGFTAAAGALAFSRAWAQTPEVPAAEPETAGTPAEAEAQPDANIATTTSRFEHMTAPVRINGAGPFQFVVDTGANRSCVATSLAEQLGLPAGKPVTVHTSVGRRVRQTAMIERLEVGPRSTKQVHAPILPIALRADGVLGVDWLKGQRLVLNFKDQRMEITGPKPEQGRADRVIVPARRRMGQLTIVDADLGDTRINALIDSGSQVSMGNAELRRRLGPQPNRAARPERITLISVTGERFYGDLLYLPFMRLGGLLLGNVPIVFSEMSVFELWKLTTTPTVVLGMDLLTQFTEVAMDYGRSTVRFDFLGDRKPESMQP
jgi:predicted aspartyl protease